MQNRRLVFSVIIKLLILSGIILLLVVLVNSLFTGNSSGENQKASTSNEIQTVSLDTNDMFKGQIRKIRWNNREVGVLLRQFPERLLNNANVVEENLDDTIEANSRSKKQEYFVYFNLGDSNNCPLFYSAGEFKDVCSSNKFDEIGRMLKGGPSSFRLKIPPHYYTKTGVVIGKWQP